MSAISINYIKAYAEANRLKTAANECDNIVRQAQRALADLNTYWEGAAADEFIAKNAQWRKEMQSIKTEVAAISSLVKKVTDDIRDADLRAALAMKNY